jgi:hypothetical protein
LVRYPFLLQAKPASILSGFDNGLPTTPGYFSTMASSKKEIPTPCPAIPIMVSRPGRQAGIGGLGRMSAEGAAQDRFERFTVQASGFAVGH